MFVVALTCLRAFVFFLQGIIVICCCKIRECARMVFFAGDDGGGGYVPGRRLDM